MFGLLGWLVRSIQLKSKTQKDLARMAPGTFGRAYADFMQGNGLDPQSRQDVRYGAYLSLHCCCCFLNN